MSKKMLKLMGAALILTGAGLCWLSAYRERVKQREILYDLASCFYRLSDEIRITRKPIALLCGRAAADCVSDAGRFFERIAGAARDVNRNAARDLNQKTTWDVNKQAARDLNQDADFPAIWREAAENLNLNQKDKKRLIEIGGDLRGDEERVIKILSAAGEYFAGRFDNLEQSAREDNKRIAALILSGGALLVILLY